MGNALCKEGEGQSSQTNQPPSGPSHQLIAGTMEINLPGDSLMPPPVDMMDQGHPTYSDPYWQPKTIPESRFLHSLSEKAEREGPRGGLRKLMMERRKAGVKIAYFTIREFERRLLQVEEEVEEAELAVSLAFTPISVEDIDEDSMRREVIRRLHLQTTLDDKRVAKADFEVELQHSLERYDELKYLLQEAEEWNEVEEEWIFCERRNVTTIGRRKSNSLMAFLQTMTRESRPRF
ncbi:uncharacterized protein RSE6_01757 [Rhynchosporium secalis]|uniref:Uncharacterized protein n=1 Tax=Rhynchosporium secalis TaxID=38038 RepID=A0A1E1LYI8_RHYSE|nr:uncharacterized protein RSE6_01757 [Rhynchosporium secalis]